MVNKKRVGMMVAVTLLIGVLLFCSVFFLVRRANREITQRSFDELATATRQIAKDLADAANADQTILSAMAELIAGQDERDNDAVLRIMKSFSLSETFVSTVALLRPDGTLLLTDGTRYDVSDTFDFETEAARGAYISDPRDKLLCAGKAGVLRNSRAVEARRRDRRHPLRPSSSCRSFPETIRSTSTTAMPSSSSWTATTATSCWIPGMTRSATSSELRGRKMLKGYTYEVGDEKKSPTASAAICAPYPAPQGLTVYLHYEPVGINNLERCARS